MHCHRRWCASSSFCLLWSSGSGSARGHVLLAIMSLRQEKKIFLIDLLCPKLDLLEQLGFSFSWWRFSNPHDLWMVPAEWRWLWMWPVSLFCTHLGDLPVVVTQDTFPSHFFCSLWLLSEIAHNEESDPAWHSWGGCWALSLGTLCTLLRLWHTAGREGKILQFFMDSEELLFPRAFPISCIKQDNHLRSSLSVRAGNSTLQLCLPWKSSWFPKAVHGN